mgnify:CR=1 FL=1
MPLGGGGGGTREDYNHKSNNNYTNAPPRMDSWQDAENVGAAGGAKNDEADRWEEAAAVPLGTGKETENSNHNNWQDVAPQDVGDADSWQDAEGVQPPGVGSRTRNDYDHNTNVHNAPLRTDSWQEAEDVGGGGGGYNNANNENHNAQTPLTGSTNSASPSVESLPPADYRSAENTYDDDDDWEEEGNNVPMGGGGDDDSDWEEQDHVPIKNNSKNTYTAVDEEVGDEEAPNMDETEGILPSSDSSNNNNDTTAVANTTNKSGDGAPKIYLCSGICLLTIAVIFSILAIVFRNSRT